MGESISVDGCCLTVVAIAAGPDGRGRAGFEADASSETLARTTLGTLRMGVELNLERATKLGQRMGGHIVTGHVDGIGKVEGRRAIGEAIELTFGAPPSLARYIAEKGSICVNGVSLTVNRVFAERFDVAIIPHTRTVTSLDALAQGDVVNLEVDVVARYVARLLEAGPDTAENRDAQWMDRLKRAGYV